MAQTSLDEIFSTYANSIGIFRDKNILSIDFSPDNIPHRESQIQQLARILAPVLRNEKPSNIFIYGKTGTGKSLCAKKVTNGLEEAAAKNGRKVKIIYLNCKMRNVTDTEYRLLHYILSTFGYDVPFTGLPTNRLYQMLFRTLGKKGGNVILVLDEIDTLLDKIGDDILYNITRANPDISGAKLTLVGISNKADFIDNLDPRIKSSLSEEEMVFPPYNANEIRDILEERVKGAFHPGVIEYGAITKCAALAAQENGDARKALDLLRVAAELCERAMCTKVTEKFVNMAQEKLDRDRVMEIIRAQPKQSKLVLLAMLNMYKKTKGSIHTGDVYKHYDMLAVRNGMKSLTQRRVSDLVSELDMLGIINASVISKGRYGRTRKINIQLNEKVVSLMSKTLAGEFTESFINF